MASERVTVTLPKDLVEGIDRLERNRSRFIAEAVTGELARRRRAGLLASIASPHAESMEVAEEGLAEWGSTLPVDDEGLLDPTAGKSVRWVDGKGWARDPG